ncbi:hypothetical protein HH310_41800 [Actinoplanes sp. TBRC 11911]|uniref:hypothetical protein n=1 Tax=Actinoplanes sp. TBRC 11911 TaxID=2729386 RepID=UPI00145F7257|nr:hypothetical protein [Actinoplanes sp. TBRC 11911]NMO57687.1 hypothetical protein [Actinoplanes sp. TBRC 11911]
MRLARTLVWLRLAAVIIALVVIAIWLGTPAIAGLSNVRATLAVSMPIDALVVLRIAIRRTSRG